MLKRVGAQFLAGIIVASFLLTFQPFDIRITSWYSFWLIAGFGLVTFVMALIPEFLFRKWVEARFSKSYTIGIMVGLYVFFIALGNVVYNYYLLGGSKDLIYETVLYSFFYTILVAIVPTGFFLLFYNLKQRKLVEATLLEKQKELEKKTTSDVLQFKGNGKNEVFQIPFEHVFFLQSQDNYVTIHFQSNTETRQHLMRTTLKQIEQNLPHPDLLRCHRSFLVNGTKIQRLEKNGTSGQLHLINCPSIVLVSKKYLKEIGNYINSA